MGKMKELDMAKQEIEAISEPQEREQVINRDGEEVKFYLSDLSNEGHPIKTKHIPTPQGKVVAEYSYEN